MNELRNAESLVVRHADKGSWKINEEELRAQLPGDVVSRIMAVLRHEFPGMLEKGETPLKLEGIKRSIKLGENLFSKLPDRCILVVMDSGKDRAQLTRHIATNRIDQLEREYNKNNEQKKGIDVVEVDDEEIAKLAAYSDPKSWAPYRAMIDRKEISADAAALQWLMELNRGKDGQKSPEAEGGKRYRQLIEMVHKNVSGGKDRDESGQVVPIILLVVGHNESMAQIMLEEKGGVMKAEDLATFCEQYQFDNTGKLVGTEKLVLE